jgi:hypothetical protein
MLAICPETDNPGEEKDWGKTFSPEKIQTVQNKNVLKRLATSEVFPRF